MSDGSVTMEMQGEFKKVEELITRIKGGDDWISGKNFEEYELPVTEGETKFEIR